MNNYAVEDMDEKRMKILDNETKTLLANAQLMRQTFQHMNDGHLGVESAVRIMRILSQETEATAKILYQLLPQEKMDESLRPPKLGDKI